MLAIEGAALHGDPDEARAIFLRWKDRDLRKAEKAAYEWAERLQPFLCFALPVATAGIESNTHAVVQGAELFSQVSNFIKERHVRRYFPNNSTAARC